LNLKPSAYTLTTMSMLNSIRGIYGLLGLKGAVATALNRLTGYPRQLSIAPTGVQGPVRLRLRTSDVSVYKDVLVRREYEIPMDEVRTIVDAGANIGMASIYYANRFPSAKIMAVEPQRDNYALLVRNVSPYPNIVPVHAALWKFDGEIRLGLPENDCSPYARWAFTVMPSGKEVVRAVSMRTLMREAGFTSVDLLKVDIEGGEMELFQNDEWVNRVSCVMIELHDRIRPGCRKIVTRALRDFGSAEHGELTIFRRHHLKATTSE
jgi:FkbM family methyltransferase